MRENLFFLGTWLTVIFLKSPLARAAFLGLNMFTWRPTLIFLVRAPWGKTACTCGTTVELTTPPSGPMACTSCLILVMMAKYCGKSVVRILVIRLVFRSSSWVASANRTCSDSVIYKSMRYLRFLLILIVPLRRKLKWVLTFQQREVFAAPPLQCKKSVKQRLTSFIKAVLKNFLDSFLRCLEGVLLPVLTVVRPEDDNLSLLAPQGGKVGNLEDDRSKELGSSWTELKDSAGNCLSLHQRRWVDKLVLLQIPEQKGLIMPSLLVRRTNLQVTLIGMGAFLGGMITLTPEWRQPRIAPPRASTMNDTRNLKKTNFNFDPVIPLTTVSWSSERSRCEATDKLKVSRRYFRGFTFGALMVFARQSLKKMFKLSLILTIEVSVPNNFFLLLLIGW